MKRNTLERKLVLNKKTVSNLENQEMKNVKGGAIGTYYATCVSLAIVCNTNEDCSCKITICA